jgi:NAD(P)-dependent dehydrogenase (short-subunit alcohol dehydrogenase family)
MMAELSFKPAIAVDLDEWNKILSVNLTGALLCAQAVVASMRARGGGKIVNQVSGGAFPPSTVYGISKIALLGLTTTLARELGPDKINVNAIAPGNVMSDAGRALTPDEAPFVQKLKDQIALRMRGEPDELVGPLLLLCSSAGDWMTGQVLHVDGGWIIRP